MSTRSVIARPANTEGEKIAFRGVYHHWDGYPTGLGASLWWLYREQFDRDLEKMLRVLVDEHPAGWSTINGVDFSLPIGNRDDNLEPCEADPRRPDDATIACGRPHWEHYRQYYAGESHTGKAYDGSDRTPPTENVSPSNPVLVLGHTPRRNYSKPRAPECYCHGARSDEPWAVTEENAADAGCEWAYVLKDTPDGAYMMILSSYSDVDGVPHKMIGMFGMGDPNAYWKPVAVVGLDVQVEPEWHLIETGEPLELPA